MAYPIDWGGIATLVGAVGGFITVMVNVFITIMNWRDNRRLRLEQETHKQLLCNIATQVGADTNVQTH